jgi:hypothetical protein
MHCRTCFVLLLAATLAHADKPDPARVGTSKTVGDLELIATVEPTNLDVSLALHNTGKKPLAVLSHIKTHELHYDWFEIELTWPKAEKDGTCKGTGRLVLKLSDARNKSYPVTETIAPGGLHVQKISIPAWAARKVNGSVTLGGGFYKIVARYRVANEKGVWNGTLETAPARVLGLDQQRTDMCKTNPGWDKW